MIKLWIIHYSRSWDDDTMYPIFSETVPNEFEEVPEYEGMPGEALQMHGPFDLPTSVVPA